MTSDDLHPDLRRAARFLPRGAYTARTVPLMQAVTRSMALLPAGDVEKVSLPGGKASVRVHRPDRVRFPGAALLWIHGGGYVIGSAAQDDKLCRRFARRLGVPVAAVDYRLAPQHPYPAALDDCEQALPWLARLPGVDGGRIAIGGASAGGGLTAALALRCRDRKDVTPLFQLLVYPMVDDEAGHGPGVVGPGSRMWNETTNRVGWESYLRGADRDVAVPTRHHDLGGLPPAWLGVGTVDPLHGEGTAYARRLTEAGVPCELHEVPGAFHGFDAVVPGAAVSRDFFDRQCRALEAAFGAN